MTFGIAKTGIAIWVALAATEIAWADTCEYRPLFELPMTPNDLGSPIVPIEIDGTPRDVLLDTGGFWSMIQPSVAAPYPHRQSRVEGWLGLEGIRVDTAVEVPSIQLGATAVPHVDFLVEPQGFSDVAATLGANWLGRFDVEIDPVEDMARFFASSSCSGPDVVRWPHSDLAELPVKIDQGVNLMTIPVILDGWKIDALIDTGAVETYLSERIADRLFGAKHDGSSAGVEGADGADQPHRRQFRSLQLGGIEFADPWLIVAPISSHGPQMILGMHQLRGLHLYFAYRRRMLYATTARGDIAARQAIAAPGTTAVALRDPTAVISARDFLASAEEAEARNDFAAAVTAADRAVESDPGYAPAYLERAEIYRKRGLQGAAIENMEHAVSLDPKSAAGILSLSELYVSAGDTDRAMAEADKAIQLGPHAGVSFAVRAEAYAAKGLMDRALQDSIAAIRLEPDAVIGYLSRSHIHELAGDYSRAFEFADKAVAVQPQSASALNARCWNGALLGRLESALQDCDRAVALLPYNSEILDSRAFVHLKAGRTDAAIADFSAALAVNPRLASSLYGRGLARRQTSESAAAAADIAAAAAIDPLIAQHFGK
jgi:tetratricopeptide (TPR) repeat protein